MTSTPDLRNKLPTDLLKHTHSQARAKTFADKASLELKIEMLSRLGIESCVFFSLPEYLNKEAFLKTYKDYKANNRLKSMDDMIEKKQFAFASRELMSVLAVMGQNCHHDTYMLNREYATLAGEIAQMSKHAPKIKDIELVKSVMEDHKMIVTLLMFNLLNQTFVDSFSAFTVRELEIMMYLFIQRKGSEYLPIDTVCEHFKNKYSKQTISAALHKMHKSFHIDRFPRTQKYAIASLGIQVLCSYISRLLNSTLTR